MRAVLLGFLAVEMMVAGQASSLAQVPKSAPINARAAVPAGGMETDTNRFGSDYRSFDAPSAELCQIACTNDATCRAWTWVKPGVQGPSGKCWLKNQVPPATANSCCVSGVHAQAQIKPAPQAQVQPQAQAKRAGLPAPVAAPIRVVNPLRRTMGQDRGVALGRQNEIAASNYRALITEKGQEHMIATGVITPEVRSINGQKPAGFVLRPDGAVAIHGIGFGKSGSLALFGNFRVARPGFIQTDWRPTVIYARLANVSGEEDVNDIRLEITPYSGKKIIVSGLRFEAAWDEGSTPLKDIPRRFAGFGDPQPFYSTNGQRPDAEIHKTSFAQGAQEGYIFARDVPMSTLIVVRHAWGQGTSPFRPGTDTYTLALRPGFAVSHLDLRPGRTNTSPIDCRSSTQTESGGTYFAGKYGARVESDNVIKIDWGVWRCHASGFLSPGYNEHLSGYGLDVYISGPRGVSPWQ